MKNVENSKATGEAQIEPVVKNDPRTASKFLSLGRDYLSDLPNDERERFLQSILARQGEPNRWLLLLKHQNKHVGFIHMKIDNDERPCRGFILEFYIMPLKRRRGLGRTLFAHSEDILKKRGVKSIWLLTNSSAEPFWRSLGFRSTGEKDKETGQTIMAKSF